MADELTEDDMDIDDLLEHELAQARKAAIEDLRTSFTPAFAAINNMHHRLSFLRELDPNGPTMQAICKLQSAIEKVMETAE